MPGATNYRSTNPFDAVNNNPADPPREVTRIVAGVGSSPESAMNDNTIVGRSDYAAMRSEFDGPEADHNRAHGCVTFGQAMIVRGSLERLTPVLMTALVAAFASTPLLLAADAPGKEILHPVAVVIFGGLISSTLPDTLITPLMYAAVGRAPTERLLGTRDAEAV